MTQFKLLRRDIKKYWRKKRRFLSMVLFLGPIIFLAVLFGYSLYHQLWMLLLTSICLLLARFTIEDILRKRDSKNVTYDIYAVRLFGYITLIFVVFGMIFGVFFALQLVGLVGGMRLGS